MYSSIALQGGLTASPRVDMDFQTDHRETIKYLQLIQEHLSKEWLKTGDPNTKAEMERIAAEIAELEAMLKKVSD
jgi:hypothetical protein